MNGTAYMLYDGGKKESKQLTTYNYRMTNNKLAWNTSTEANIQYYIASVSHEIP